jgi:hypothetical protein
VIPVDISPKLVSALIGAVYDCALNPSRWENALGEMVTALECHNALLSLTGHALRSPASHAQLWHERGLVRAFQDKHVPEVAAQLSRIIATWLPDKPFVMSRDLSPDIVQNSAYIEDAFRPEGIVDVLQCFLVGSPKRFAGLALGRRQPPGIFFRSRCRVGRVAASSYPPAVASTSAYFRCWHIASFRCAVELGRYRGIADSDNPSTGQIYGFTA